MSEPTPGSRVDALLVALAIYGAASFIHFAHNATFADAYPNLPESLTPLRIVLAWVAEAALGFTGYIVMRKGFPRTGLALIVAYATLGFDGFAHYLLAPMSAHTMAMNATIWAEAITGAALLLIAGMRFFQAPAPG